MAEAGRDGEVRYFETFENTPDAIVKLVRKLSGRYEKLHFCYEAGPTGMVFIRRSWCLTIPALWSPRRSSRSDRVKTDRGDAQTLAKLLRAGELTAVCVPDETHKAVRDLVRTRAIVVALIALAVAKALADGLIRSELR